MKINLQNLGNRRHLIVAVFAILLVIGGSFFVIRNTNRADSGDDAYAEVEGKITLASTGGPAGGFIININNYQAETEADGTFLLSLPETDQGTITFIRKSDYSRWQRADSFESIIALSAGLHKIDFSLEPIPTQ